ncbi:HIT family protein [Candidatus Thorarchaeota archaeon]|nr:MAG: HIT family protein [Candidatus Thorarchaeota archaeon]
MSNAEDCLFCKIVSGEIPSSRVFEDDICMAFMDVFPIREGHCLLVPKEHYQNLLDVDKDVVAHMARRLVDLTRKVDRVLEPDGILTSVANGKGAGQEIPHLHFHVIPRNHGDDFGFRFPPDYREEMADRDGLDSLASKMSRA